MNIVLLKPRSRQLGGLEKYTARIAKAFIGKGAQVTFLTAPPSRWPAFIQMEQFDRFIAQSVKEIRPDLVFGMERSRHQTHIRAGNGVHAAYLASRIHTEGLFKVLLCKVNPLHRKILELEKAAFESPSLQKLFTNSHMVRHQILERYQTDPAKIQVIHNGVEWDEMEADFAQWEEKRLSKNRFHFLFIGNGYLRKGLDRLLMGLAQLRNRDFQLSVVGKEKKIDAYKAKVFQLGLQNQVHFYGPVPNIRLFYQQADALVIPSFYDPFANVTVEALAMGLYVVSSKFNGGHEILTPTNGTIIDDLLDSHSMVAALETALKHPKTRQNSHLIRESVKHLDFSQQLRTLVDSCG